MSEPGGVDEEGDGEVVEVETERVEGVIDVRDVVAAMREEAVARAAQASAGGGDRTRDAQTLTRIGELADELVREIERLGGRT